jgi:regulatory protein
MKKITKIEQQKKSAHRQSVYVDDEFSFGADEVMISELKLAEGLELEDDRFEEIKKTALTGLARERAFRFISRQMKSKRAVTRKLIADGFPEDIAEYVVENLAEEQFLDDFEYALSFINDKMNLNGWGSHKIAFELSCQGIDSETFRQAFDETKIDEVSVARKLLQKHNISDQRKADAFLSRRGFPHEVRCALRNE